MNFFLSYPISRLPSNPIFSIGGAFLCAVQNGVNTFTSLDTARIVLDALEEVIPEIHTIDENV